MIMNIAFKVSLVPKLKTLPQYQQKHNANLN